MVSFQQLRQADSGSLRGAADGVRKLARELDQFGTETDRHRVGLASSWTGMDADAAGQKLTTHIQDFQNTAQSYGKVDNIVSTLAGEIDGAKQLLESAISMAPSIPGSVGQDGSVHVNWSALGPNPSPAAISRAQQNAQQVAGYIRDAVMRATAADQRAQSELVAVTGSANVRVSSGSGSTTIPAEGTDPHQVKRWWDDLSLEQQQQLINTNPHEIGGMDGVPVTARDEANRIGLAQERTSVLEQHAAAEQRLKNIGMPSGDDYHQRREYDDARRDVSRLNERIENINSIQEQLDRTDLNGSTERLHLIDYDSAHDGQAVISVGNPDTANNVVTHVPGTGADVPGIGGQVDRALAMQTDATTADPNRNTSTIIWLGYDAPDRVVPNAIFAHYYEDAAADLASFQQGLRATHEGPPSINTLMGHSYGASTVSHTAANHDLAIDNLIQVASPGGGAGGSMTANDYLAPGADNVWATRAGDDSIRWVSQIHGNDPIDFDFGGRVFPADDGGHGGYWDPNNQARGHIANIVTGQYNLVPEGRQDGAPRAFSR